MDTIYGFIDEGGIARGPELREEFEVFKNYVFYNIESLFKITIMMIGGNSEMKNVLSMDTARSLWEKSALLNDQAMETNLLVSFEKLKYSRHLQPHQKAVILFVLKPRTHSYTKKGIPRGQNLRYDSWMPEL